MKRRNPAVAFVLSFLAPGMGHLYWGRAGMAFTLGILFCLAAPALIAVWSFTRFSPFWLGVGFVVLGPFFRLATAAWAAFAAQAHPDAPQQKWQRPLTYAVFFMVSVATVFNLSSFVDRRFARRYQMPTAALAPEIQQGDGLWILRTKNSRLPQKGARAVFESPDPRQAPFLVEVVATGGDKVEVGNEGVFVNGQKKADAFGSKPLPETTLREGQVFGISPGKSTDPAVRDSRDVGPLPVGDYLGEIALVDPPSSRGIIPWAGARWLPRKTP